MGSEMCIRDRSEEERFFDPDENDTYEIGLRSRFLDGKLQFNATFFLIDWDQLQVGTSADGATPFTALITSNLGSAESKGLEVELNYRFGGFKFNAGLATIDATFDSGTISQRVVRAGLCDDIVCAADGNVCLLYTSPSPRDLSTSRMPSSA